MVQGKWFPQGSDISIPLSLRGAVLAKGRDELDELAQQVVVYDEGMPVGTARLWWDEGAFHIGDLGVLAESRGKGFGDLLVRLTLFKALQHHAQWVELEAPLEALPFFTRYGFALAGDPQANGPFKMRLRGEDISLSHCGGHCAGCQG